MFRSFFFIIEPVLLLIFPVVAFLLHFRRLTNIRAFAEKKQLDGIPANIFTSSQAVSRILNQMSPEQQALVDLLRKWSSAAWVALAGVVLTDRWLRYSAQ